MSTVTKTLSLLNHLSAARPEMGLTEFREASGFDKATTHRRLRDLVAAGFLDQDPVRRTYRLGPAVTRLALVRDQSQPADRIAREVLARLYAEIGETVHVSLRQGTEGLSTLAHVDDQAHGNRVSIDPAAVLPFHATASGLAVLAFAEDGLTVRVLGAPLPAITAQTETDPARLAEQLAQIRRAGIGICAGGFEAEVVGISAPFFDGMGRCIGAVAAAGPASRMTPDRHPTLAAALIRAAEALTRTHGGQIPAIVSDAWAKAAQT